MTDRQDWLQRAAQRCSTLDWSLGMILENYCDLESISRADLATLLGCDSSVLDWLSLCRRPAPETFAREVDQIAKRFGVKQNALSSVVRHVDAIRVIGLAQKGEPQLLMAARDRKKKGE